MRKADKKDIKNAKRGANKASLVQEAEQVVEALALTVTTLADWNKLSRLESDSEYERAGEALVQVKARLNEGDRERKLIVDPLNGVVKHVNQKFKQFTGPLEDLEEHLKAIRKDYVELKRLEVVKAAEKEARRAEKQGANQVALDIRERALTVPVAPVNSAIHTRRRWMFRIVDESQVPREYLMVDESKIRRLVGPDAPEIPGVEIFEDTREAVTA